MALTQSSYKNRTFLEYKATTPRINNAANLKAYGGGTVARGQSRNVLSTLLAQTYQW